MNIYISGPVNINKFTEDALDESLFEEIYLKYYKNVYNYISFRINNHHDTEELVSKVFEKVILKFHTFDPNFAPVEAWLIGISKNTVTDYLRAKKNKSFIPIDELVGLVSKNKPPEEVIVVKEENRTLIEAMSRLKDQERQVLAMKFATELKNTEIAKLLGISESKVGVIIHRSLKKLKKLLSGDFLEITEGGVK